MNPNDKGGTYDTAQLCENGHLITDAIYTNPEDVQPFCSKCGQPTITECKSCKTQIKGRDRYSSIISEYARPNFCHKCGETYPWTERGLDAAKKYVEKIKELKPEEKELLTKSIDDIVRVAPSQKVAIVDFKRLLAKMNSPSREITIGVISDILTEGAKKAIGL